MLDFTTFENDILEDVYAALDASALTVLGIAKEKAPIRKVFRGGRRIIRFKSVEEVEADKKLRASLGLGPERVAPQGQQRPGRSRYARVTIRPDLKNTPFRPLERRLTKGGHHLAIRVLEARLSRRGRFELASGRAAHKGYLGGRLRDELFTEPARVEGSLAIAEVISPTPYAKYQEFGTRHNPAHPFLRPALAEGRGAFRRNIARAINEVARRGIPTTGQTITVKVVLKATR
jgi:HK97 gp10 family phage protein